MNTGVATQAQLMRLRRVVVRTPRRVCVEVDRWRVALEADVVHVGAIEQLRVWASVRRMACGAALDLDHRVIIDPGSGLRLVALDAHRILQGSGLRALLLVCAMGIVAVRALNQSFVHLVMEGHGELWLDVRVALKAKRRLRGLEQVFFLAVVNVVAADAAHIALGMSRAVKVLVLALMAAEAQMIYLLGSCVGGIEYPGFVAAAFNVRFARAVAVLTGDPGTAVRLRRFSVRIGSESSGHIFVAWAANLRAHHASRSSVPGLCDGRPGR